MPKRVFYMAQRSFRTPAARYPADPRAVFVLFLCVFSGIPLALGHATPGTINEQLKNYQVVIWGLLLVLGASCTLLGTFNQSVNGIITEQVGSIAVGGACIIYASAIWGQLGAVGTVPALIVGAFGAACWWRWGQLQALLIMSERTASKRRKQRGEQ